MASDPPGAAALAAVDKVLAGRPGAAGHDFSAAAICLVRFRDEMIKDQGGAGRTHEERSRLGRLNAIISVILAGHFPLGAVPWDELERARGWLADLVAEVERAD